MGTFSDWAGDFFTGDWKNAYDASPALTIGAPLALLAGGAGLAAAGGAFGAGGAAAGAFGAAEGAGAFGASEGLGAAAGFGAEEAGAGGLAEWLASLGGGEAASTGLGEAGSAFASEAGGSGFGLAGETAQTFMESPGMAGGAFEQMASGAPSGGAGGETSFIDKLIGGATKQVTNNPLGIGAAGIGLGMNMMKGDPLDPKRQELEKQASQLGAQGQQLMNYLQTGTLPPALKAQLDTATQAAKARVVANHAKNGMPTDPSQNSALAQELSQVEMNAVGAMAQAQIQMLNTGLSETGLSTKLYEMLVRMDKEDNKETMSAIMNFAAALGGSSKINLPKAV